VDTPSELEDVELEEVELEEVEEVVEFDPEEESPPQAVSVAVMAAPTRAAQSRVDIEAGT
jgi:hypothetical protein